MGKVYDGIDDTLAGWLEAQPVFFVATAPLERSGHINVSPKGLTGVFRVLGPTTVAYLDYIGSGVETIAHLREPGNGRITIMCCAFQGRPTVVRLYGRGHDIPVGDPGFAALRSQFPKAETAGQRAVVVVEVDRVADSCGYAVPLLEYVGEREVLDRSHARKSPEQHADYVVTRNARSIDGLPGLTP